MSAFRLVSIRDNFAHLKPLPRPPIFIWDPGDLGAYPSVEECESHLEAADVNESSYVGFDSLGRKLLLFVEQRPVRILFWHEKRELVRIELAPSQPSDIEEAREILFQCLDVAPSDELRAAPFHLLVELALERIAKFTVRWPNLDWLRKLKILSR